MKKQILTALMLTALSTPTLNHPLALKTVFDAGMFITNLVMTHEVKRQWNEYPLLATKRMRILKNCILTAANLGLYIYTVSGLRKAYKERKNSGTIQVKK